MHLARLVFLTVDVFPTPSKLEAEVFGLKVSSMCHWKKDRLSILLLKCEADVTGKLSRSDSNEVTFPQDIIQRVEGAIERTADLISVLRQSKRTITSPVPCIALIPKDEQERTWLEATKGIKLVNRSFLGSKYNLDLTLQKWIWDRRDGVALLSEALSHEHPTGSFHELVRFFERAFARRPSLLAKPLASFLEPTGQGYTKIETRIWFERLRPTATHADRRDDIALERDIRPFVRRMIQASYDVLFNKAEWHSPSIIRRDAWEPEYATTTPDGPTIFLVPMMTKDRPATIVATPLDDLGSYPMDLSIGLGDLVPKDWWTKRSEPPMPEATVGIPANSS